MKNKIMNIYTGVLLLTILDCIYGSAHAFNKHHTIGWVLALLMPLLLLVHGCRNLARDKERMREATTKITRMRYYLLIGA